jgi:hypothetical protein
MRALIRRAAALAVLPLLGACSGGMGSSISAPNPTAPPSTPGPIPDNVLRGAAQSALLAESAVVIAAPVTGGPRLLTVRHASSRAPRSTVACSNGYSEQDTPAGPFTTHVVVSLYTDAGCTALRQQATFDFDLGVDTSDWSGTIASFDAAGHVTATQTATDFFFASGGGYVRRQSTDAAGAATAPFGHNEIVCLVSAQQCTLAAVTDGATFETGVLLTATMPSTVSGPGSSVTIPLGGSVRFGAPGSITIVDGQPFTAPTLSGGGTPVAFTGTVSATLSANGPTAFTVSMNVGSTHVDGSLASGTTTFTIAGGATVTVNANGDGSIRYADGATEAILDFRISG